MAKLLSRDGEKITYIDIGKGPVCVLVHGIGMEARYWLPLVMPLIGKYRFILPDLRGFGASKGSKHVESNVFIQFANDLHDLVTHLALDEFALAGYSMGGMTSLMYQHLYGTEKVKAYLQIDQSPVIHNTKDWPWGLYGDEQGEKFTGFNIVFDEVKRHHDPSDWNGLPKKTKSKIKSMMADFVAGATSYSVFKKSIYLSHRLGAIDFVIDQKTWPAFWNCITHYVNEQTDLRSVLEGFDKPLWVFAGTESELYHINGQHRLAQLVDGSEIHAFMGNGHMLPYESPVRFIKLLAQFVGTTSGTEDSLEIQGVT